MGLLDALFDQSGYGGQGGGLLDLLRSSQAQNSQYQPGPGFPAQQPPASFADRFNTMPGAPPVFTPSGRSFDSAQFDPSTFAPNQVQPIAIGDYQMPRIGSADQFTPPSQSAVLPPNAQPTQGQLPPQGGSTDISAQSRQQDQPLPPALGGSTFGGNFGASLQSFANTPGGLIQKLAGGTSALITGQRTDPAGMQQQNLKAQYDSLVPTLGKQNALLAVMNPEAGKVLLQEALTNKEKYGVVSEDPFAGKKYGFINEREQTVNGRPINAQDSAAGSSSPLADMEKAKAAGVSGDALYEYLPKQIAPMVKAMVEGRQPLPTGAAMRNPATLALIDAAHSVDPTFDATSWATRQAGAKDFTSGKSSEMVRSANQTLHHVGSLLDSMESLHNRDYPLWNKFANAASEATGGGAQGAFRSNAHAVATELSKVFKGANLSDAEVHAWEQNLHENMSPDQQRTQVAKLKELLQGSLQALEEKRLAAIGPMAAAKSGPIIKDDAQRIMERIDKWTSGGGKTVAGGAADPLGIR